MMVFYISFFPFNSFHFIVDGWREFLNTFYIAVVFIMIFSLIQELSVQECTP